VISFFLSDQITHAQRRYRWHRLNRAGLRKGRMPNANGKA
jgi:hypothetical protein